MNSSLNTEAASQIALWEELQAHPQIFSELLQPELTEFALQKLLREKYHSDLVRAAITIQELRHKARDKFTQADQMWFDRIGLEQSTPEQVALHKAKRFEGEVRDLCCGIGADSTALAGRGPVISYDLDPRHCWQALENAKAYNASNQLETVCEDVTKLNLTGQLVHVDPDRRAGKGKARTIKLEHYAPDLAFMQQLAETARGGAIKVSPASNFYGKFFGTELELISLHGECKEATIWFGELAEPDQHRATVLPTGVTLAGNPLEAEFQLQELGRYLYDPDPGVVRASLIDLLAEQLEAGRLDEDEEYLTSDNLIDSPFVQAFEVLDVLPNNPKLLKKYFQQHQYGQAEIKCRHLPIDATTIRKRLPLSGSKPVTLIFARLAGKAHALITQRVSQTS